MQSHGHQLVTEHHDEQGQNHHQKHDHRVEGCYDAHQKIISLLLHVIYHVEPPHQGHHALGRRPYGGYDCNGQDPGRFVVHLRDQALRQRIHLIRQQIRHQLHQIFLRQRSIRNDRTDHDQHRNHGQEKEKSNAGSIGIDILLLHLCGKIHQDMKYSANHSTSSYSYIFSTLHPS